MRLVTPRRGRGRRRRRAVGPFRKRFGSNSTNPTWSHDFLLFAVDASALWSQATHPSHSRYDDPYENSEHHDGECDLNPQAKVPNRSFDAVSPGVWYMVTYTFDYFRGCPLPPG